MKGRGAGIVLLFVLALLIPALGHAAGFNDVVLDERGNFVYDMRGNCVYTKWPAASDICAGEPEQVKQEKHTYSRPYIVFFDFDKSNVTAEAGSTMNTLYKDAKKAVQAWYHITGHADRSGTDAYNMALSKRRADAVRAKLIKMGVPANNITTDFKGEREPLVQTKDGVREPQNRRAEIRLTVEEIKGVK